MTGFIGGGNMAEALIKGMLLSGKSAIMVSEPLPQRRQHLESTFDIRTTDSNAQLVSECEIIVLAVKPQNMDELLAEISPLVNKDKTVVSIAAGITLSYLKDRLKTQRLVRVMPNMAAMLQESMSVLSLCECFPDQEMARVRDIFMASGRVLVLPEKHMDAVTAVSGSGPAFIALFAACMVQSAMGMGLSEDEALNLVSQTLTGTARMLDGHIRPADLIDKVRSPGGTTAEGLKVFEGEGLGELVDNALKAAARRSAELAR